MQDLLELHFLVVLARDLLPEVVQLQQLLLVVLQLGLELLQDVSPGTLLLGVALRLGQKLLVATRDLLRRRIE